MSLDSSMQLYHEFIRLSIALICILHEAVDTKKK
jgi:hypothetical protein